MKNNILEINDLTLAFKKDNRQNVLLNRLSFCVPVNKVTGIAGESGSGKSLTALSIMRLCPPGMKITSGSISLNEYKSSDNLLSLSEKEMQEVRGKKISMIFQEPMTSLNPSLKCGFQVAEALKTHDTVSQKIAYEKLIHLFREVRLPYPERIARLYPHQLSGGQRQRVMIAMALIANPLLLIADEPTTALDVTVQKKILELLNEIICSHNLSILFITHDLRLLKAFAHHIIIMREGQIIETGPSKDIFNSPAHPYTKGLIACQPPLRHTPTRLLTIRDFEEGLTIPDNKKTGEKPSHQEIILTIKNLSVFFFNRGSILIHRTEKINAVNTIDLEVFRGETVGIAGESGCGKTSLGKAILNLLPETYGNIYYKGVNIRGLKGNALRDYRKKVQVVFQDPYSSLNPLQTAGEIIAEPMKVHLRHLSPAERRDRCINLLEKVGIPADSADKYPHQFSGGQRQRIGIARSLALEPEMIILDEAVSALDVSVQAQILNLLNDLKMEFGLTYIFISHDLSVVKYMSDRIIIMKDGKIEETGEAEEIFFHPHSEYTKLLIGSIPGSD